MSFVYACYICLVSLRLVSSWSLQRCCLLLQIKQLSVVSVRPVSPVSPVCRLSYCRDNANREQNHQACLNVMPRCRLSYAKIMQTASRIIKSCLNIMPRCSLSYCKDNANWHNYKIKICQRSHYFSSLPFKMTFFSQFALLHHVLRNIIYDFFINRNTINHSRPVVSNIDMCVVSYPQSPD